MASTTQVLAHSSALCGLRLTRGACSRIVHRKNIMPSQMAAVRARMQKDGESGRDEESDAGKANQEDVAGIHAGTRVAR